MATEQALVEHVKGSRSVSRRSVSKRSVSRRTVVRTIAAFAMCLPFLYPFYYLAVTALKTTADYLRDPLGFPASISSAQFRAAWDQADLGRAMLNSCVAAGVGAVVLLVLSVPAAEWCSRSRSRGKAVVLGCVGVVWMVPTIVLIIPLFVELTRLHMTNNLIVLGVVYGVGNALLGVFLVYAFLGDSLDPQIREAAAVDGAKPRQTFARVIVPICRPVLGAVAVLGFLFAWGDLLIALLLLESNSLWTIPLAATDFVTARVSTSRSRRRRH